MSIHVFSFEHVEIPFTGDIGEAIHGKGKAVAEWTKQRQGQATA